MEFVLISEDHALILESYTFRDLLLARQWLNASGVCRGRFGQGWRSNFTTGLKYVIRFAPCAEGELGHRRALAKISRVG